MEDCWTGLSWYPSLSCYVQDNVTEGLHRRLGRTAGSYASPLLAVRLKGFPPDSETAFSPPKTQSLLEEMHIYIASAATHMQRENTFPYTSLPEQHTAASPGPVLRTVLSHVLPSGSTHPQTALTKSKSANTWRSLVSLVCSGETQVSQGTDIIPDSMVQTSRQRDAQGLLLIRMSLPAYLFWLNLLVEATPTISLWPPHQLCNAYQSNHLNKTRFLSHIPDGQNYSRKVSDPGLGPCRTWAWSHQLPKQPSAMCNTGCNFRVQAQRRNPHGGAGSEMAPGRPWQATARVVQGQAQGKLRAPLGSAGTISHAEQLNSCRAALIETPVLPLCLASSHHCFTGWGGEGRAYF